MAIFIGPEKGHYDVVRPGSPDVVRHQLMDAAARASIAPTEATSTAGAAHTAGSYFILNGTLYRATVAIAAGDTITPGTNCEAVSGGIGGEVSGIKSAVNGIETGADVAFEWTAGKNYYVYTNGGLTGTTAADSAIFPATPYAADAVKRPDIGAVYAKDGYNVRYFLTSDVRVGSTLAPVVSYSSWAASLELPDDAHNYYLFLCVKKLNGEAITAAEAAENVFGIPTIQEKFNSVDNRLSSIESALPSRENLFNPNDTDIVYGSYISAVNEGSIVWTTNENFLESGFIPILAGEKIAIYTPDIRYLSTNISVAWFDANKEIISVRSFATNGVYTAPTNCAYARLPIAISRTSKIMVLKVLSTDPSPFTGEGIEYAPYGGYKLAAIASSVNKIETGADVAFNWTAGKNYYVYTNGGLTGTDAQDSAIFPASPYADDAVKRQDIGAVYAKDGYNVRYFLTSSVRVGQTLAQVVDYSSYADRVELPHDVYNYFLFLCVKKLNGEAITAAEAAANVFGVPTIQDRFDVIDERLDSLESVIPSRENLFDPNDADIVYGSYISSVSDGSAVWTISRNNLESGYIPLLAGDKIAIYTPDTETLSTNTAVAWYNASKEILSVRAYATNGVYTAPTNCAYARVATAISRANRVMVLKVLSTDPTPFTGEGIEYVPYGGYKMPLFATKDVCPGYQWRGKKWYAYGTSITANTGNTVTTGKYALYLSLMSGMTLYNKGIAGQGIGNFGATSTGQVYSAICNTTDGKLDADLITLETGANDVNAGVPLGTIFDTGTSTLAGCLNDCLRYLQINTDAQVVVTVSPPSINSSDKYFEWAAMVEQICAVNRVHFVNNSTNMGKAKISDATKGSLYIEDNIHQTNLGGYIMAENLWYQLRNIPLFYTELPI